MLVLVLVLALVPELVLALVLVLALALVLVLVSRKPATRTVLTTMTNTRSHPLAITQHDCCGALALERDHVMGRTPATRGILRRSAQFHHAAQRPCEIMGPPRRIEQRCIDAVSFQCLASSRKSARCCR